MDFLRHLHLLALGLQPRLVGTIQQLSVLKSRRLSSELAHLPSLVDFVGQGFVPSRLGPRGFRQDERFEIDLSTCRKIAFPR
jgi:hypothetical protein